MAVNLQLCGVTDIIIKKQTYSFHAKITTLFTGDDMEVQGAISSHSSAGNLRDEVNHMPVVSGSVVNGSFSFAPTTKLSLAQPPLRLPVIIRSKLHIGDTFVDGHLYDISRCGALLHCLRRETISARLGDRIRLSFGLPHSTSAFELLGEIVWHEHNLFNRLGKPVLCLGVHFIEDSAPAILTIEKFIQDFRHTVLIVDDDPLLLKSLERLFAPHYHVITCANAADALVQLHNNEVALLISDQRMQFMTGLQLLEHVSQQLPDTHMQRIIISAYPGDITLTHLMNTGNLFSCIEKPFDPSTLEQVVKRAVDAYAMAIENERLQIELLRANARLQSELDATTAKLQQQLTEREQLELSVRHTQKLEAVGQLAAGIAHEINTPIQYITDSMFFLQNSCQDILSLLKNYQEASKLVHPTAIQQRLLEQEQNIDFPYLTDEVPRAFQRVHDGLGRVTTIVRAMKEFGHTDNREKSPADINKAIENVLAVAKNEYKYVATIETDFAELPMVACYIGDLGQVFLNLIVNAAHAIGDVFKITQQLGKIQVKTSVVGEYVVIAISDSGAGISVAIQQRIFEPFFTTKEIGKGTGQGLAIARSIVMDKHAGDLSFTSDLGKGTTFTIRLPIKEPASPA